MGNFILKNMNYKYFSFPHTPENYAVLKNIFENEDIGRLLEDERIYNAFYKENDDISNFRKVLVSANPNTQIFIIIEKEKYSDSWKTVFSNYVEYESLEKAQEFLTIQRLQK